jgi:hypothetical protein
MALFRIETATDEASGHVSAQIFREPGGALVAGSGPIYASQEEAEERLIDAISKAWPQQPVDPVYPANGS